MEEVERSKCVVFKRTRIGTGTIYGDSISETGVKSITQETSYPSSDINHHTQTLTQFLSPGLVVADSESDDNAEAGGSLCNSLGYSKLDTFHTTYNIISDFDLSSGEPIRFNSGSVSEMPTAVKNRETSADSIVPQPPIKSITTQVESSPVGILPTDINQHRANCNSSRKTSFFCSQLFTHSNLRLPRASRHQIPSQPVLNVEPCRIKNQSKPSIAPTNQSGGAVQVQGMQANKSSLQFDESSVYLQSISNQPLAQYGHIKAGSTMASSGPTCSQSSSRLYPLPCLNDRGSSVKSISYIREIPDSDDDGEAQCNSSEELLTKSQTLPDSLISEGPGMPLEIWDSDDDVRNTKLWN